MTAVVDLLEQARARACRTEQPLLRMITQRRGKVALMMACARDFQAAADLCRQAAKIIDPNIEQRGLL